VGRGQRLLVYDSAVPHFFFCKCFLFIWRVKSIIIIIIIINLGLTGPFQTQETWGWKGAPDASGLGVAGAYTKVPWVLQPRLAEYT
jgi:hypothetical protein